MDNDFDKEIRPFTSKYINYLLPSSNHKDKRKKYGLRVYSIFVLYDSVNSPMLNCY